MLKPNLTTATPTCPGVPSARMVHAFQQFNQGLYWQQHETLETEWRAETREELRNFYKGVIQVGVGFYHLTRGNYPGVIKVLTRGIQYLRPYTPNCFGVNTARLVQEASAVLERVEILGPDRLAEIPWTDLPRVHREPSANASWGES